MSRVLMILAAVSLTCLSGCERKPVERDAGKMRECMAMTMAGRDDPERDCKKCCDKAGAGYTWDLKAGCGCY